VIGLGTVIVALAGMKAHSIQGTGKYVENLANIVQVRILPDDARRRFFADHGLPIPPIVADRSGAPAFIDQKLFMRDDELTEVPGIIDYRNWLRMNGPPTYLKFLLTNPGYLVRAFWRAPNLHRQDYMGDLEFSIADLFSRPFEGYGKTSYPDWLASLLLVPFGWFIALLYIVIATANYVVNTTRMHPASRIDTAAMAAAAALFIGFHSEAWDPWRHAIPFVVIIYIALVLRTFDAVGILYLYWRAQVEAGYAQSPLQELRVGGPRSGSLGSLGRSETA
jgi:hypothetical protein